MTLAQSQFVLDLGNYLIQWHFLRFALIFQLVKLCMKKGSDELKTFSFCVSSIIADHAMHLAQEEILGEPGGPRCLCSRIFLH
jgi:hypothetical protein